MATNSLVKLKERLESMHARHKGHIERARKGINVAADAAVIAGTAAGFGVIQGRYGAKKIGPVPIDLATGVVAHLVAISGPGKYAHQLHNIGHGAIAAYGVAMGRGYGKRMRAKAGEKPLIEGALDAADRILGSAESGGGMTDESELVAAARRL
jgi:ABC-type Fe3+ transport system substrate-binding protein